MPASDTAVRRLASMTAAVALAAGAATFAAVPVAAHASTAESCEITTGELTWGVKESFRSYMSGSIARGTWTPVGGATYTTPVFGFSAPSGTVDGDQATARYPGAVEFVGHDGLLRTTISEPTIVLTGPERAQLVLDVVTVPMEQAMAGDETVQTHSRVPFADVTISAESLTRTDGAVSFAAIDAPAAITAEGYAAFGNYEAGTALDPLTISFAATCAAAAPTPAATVDTPATEAAEPEPSDTSSPAADAESDDATATAWLPIGLGIGALVVAAAGVLVAVARRKRSGNPSDVDPAA